MKISTRTSRSSPTVSRIRALRAAAPDQGNASRRRHDGTERRFQLLLAALRPAAG
jgi:hypothetical protein